MMPVTMSRAVNYRAIEIGEAAARATTLVNIARALNLEMMLIPKPLLPAVRSMLRPSEEEDRPAFVADAAEEDAHEPSFRP